MANEGKIDGASPSNEGEVLAASMTAVLGNTALLASLSEETVGGWRREGERGEREGGEREGAGEVGWWRREGERGEREGGEREGAGEEGPKTYSVTRKHSGKRMRCELEGEGEGDREGEGKRAVKRRHSIYTSKSRDGMTVTSAIRASKSATAIGQLTSDPSSPSFKFSIPMIPSHTPVQCKPVLDSDMESLATKTASNLFTFSNPRMYVAKKRVVANDDDNEEFPATRLFGGGSEGGRVCGASPIPSLPELPPPPVPPKARGLLDEGFLCTPLPQHAPSSSPNLLDRISSELVERYPLATPLATPTNGVGLLQNDSYRRAVHPCEPLAKPVSQLAKPVSLNFTVSPENESSKVTHEVSVAIEVNHAPHSHGNTPHPTARVPLSPLKTPSSKALHPRPPRPPPQKKYALTPIVSQGPRFTDISSTTHLPLQKTSGKTPKMKK